MTQQYVHLSPAALGSAIRFAGGYDHRELAFSNLAFGFRPFASICGFCQRMLEHYLAIELIRFDEVRSPIAYYINRLNERREPFELFLDKYEFDSAKAFINRFPRDDRSRRK